MKKLEKPVIYALGLILIAAGVYTLYTTSSNLFDLFGNHKNAGNSIPVTQICSFICSFIYIVSGVLFFRKSKLATALLFVATIIMFIGYVGMLIHINGNEPFETVIIPEMLIRTSGTMLFTAAAWYFFSRIRLVYPEGYDAKSFKKLMKDYEMKKKNYSNPNYH